MSNLRQRQTSHSPPTSDKQKVLLSSDAGHFTLVRALHLADVVTLGNALCGFLSILTSVKYALHSASGVSPPLTASPWLALSLIPLGLTFDFLDGKIARWRGKSSLMGQELDSLADLISFGVAPATAAYVLGLRTPLDQVCLVLFVLAGLLRLARFNVTVAAVPKDAMGKARYFEGFPIPTSLALVGGMALVLARGEGVPGGLLHIGSGEGMHLVSLVWAVWGSLMVSKTVRIPKP